MLRAVAGQSQQVRGASAVVVVGRGLATLKPLFKPKWYKSDGPKPKTAAKIFRTENPDGKKGVAKRERKRYIAEYMQRNQELRTQAEALNMTWAMTTAAVIERTPIVIPDPEDWEVPMWRLKQELAYYDRFEYTTTFGVALLKQEKKRHEASNEPQELPFELAPRETEFDRVDDRKSMERALMHPLFLLVKKGGEWMFPEGAVNQGEEMLRDATDRATVANFGSELYIHIFGNGPSGMWYEDIDEKTDAAPKHTYFQKGIIVDPYASGPVVLGEGVEDYVWAKKEEIPEYIKGDKFLAYIERLLVV